MLDKEWLHLLDKTRLIEPTPQVSLEVQLLFLDRQQEGFLNVAHFQEYSLPSDRSLHFPKVHRKGLLALFQLHRSRPFLRYFF